MIDAAVGAILSLTILDKRLGQLRERAIERSLRGAPLDPSEIRTTEERAVAEADEALRRFGGGNEGSGDDPVPPPQELAREAVFDSHRRLMAIPFVGDPRFDDLP